MDPLKMKCESTNTKSGSFHIYRMRIHRWGIQCHTQCGQNIKNAIHINCMAVPHVMNVVPHKMNADSHVMDADPPGLRIRIPIGSGFNRVSGSGSESGSESRRAKMTHKSRKKLKNFMC